MIALRKLVVHRYYPSSLLQRSLVTHISPTTSLLRADTTDNEVYLIGTAHISQSSADEVKDLIQLVRPQTVFVELDLARAARLRASVNTKGGDPVEQAVRSAFQNFGKDGTSTALMGAAFGGFYGLLKRLGFLPGGEMLAAMNEADRIGAKLYFGDRDSNETLRDLTAQMSPKLLMSALVTPPPPELQRALMQEESLSERVETLKTRDSARMMTEWMEKAMPQVAQVMVHKRDQIMARNLRDHCSKGKVVAVVGLAHLDGIEREWQDHV